MVIGNGGNGGAGGFGIPVGSGGAGGSRGVLFGTLEQTAPTADPGPERAVTQSGIDSTPQADHR